MSKGNLSLSAPIPNGEYLACFLCCFYPFVSSILNCVVNIYFYFSHCKISLYLFYFLFSDITVWICCDL
jgi:hypothetical protein